MSRRAVLVLSGALTAFVLLIAGAAASYGLRGASGPAAPPSAPATVAEADSVPGDVVRAREAELRRLIDEANARLRDQQATIARQAALAAPPAPEPAALASPAREHEEEEAEEESDERRHHDRRSAHHEHDDG